MMLNLRDLCSFEMLGRREWWLATYVLGRPSDTVFNGLKSKARLLKMGLIGCSETSVTNYQSTLYNTPKEQRSHWHRGGNLESSIKHSGLRIFGSRWFVKYSYLATALRICLLWPTTKKKLLFVAEMSVVQIYITSHVTTPEIFLTLCWHRNFETAWTVVVKRLLFHVRILYSVWHVDSTVRRRTLSSHLRPTPYHVIWNISMTLPFSHVVFFQDISAPKFHSHLLLPLSDTHTNSVQAS
jgi:hypothetical protein